MPGPDRRGELGVSRMAEHLSAVLSPENVARGVPMRLHTSFKIGGPADFLVTVENAEQLGAVLEGCFRFGVAFLVLGRGTNLLVRDGGIRGVVVKLAGEFLSTRFDGELVEAGAGVAIADLARECGRRGLSGLEFAVGIPGSVGGAVVMNAGAYGREIKDVLESAEVLEPETLGAGAGGREAGCRGEPAQRRQASREGGGAWPRAVSRADFEFGYRTSRAQRDGWIVLSARFKLAPGDTAAIRRAEEEYTERRRTRQPLDLPSAGSVFKRPPGRYAGTLIEWSGCKGLRVGDAQVSERHAGFIVNLGSATAWDVLQLIRLVREKVRSCAGVELEPEIRIVGEDPADETPEGGNTSGRNGSPCGGRS